TKATHVATVLMSMRTHAPWTAKVQQESMPGEDRPGAFLEHGAGDCRIWHETVTAVTRGTSSPERNYCQFLLEELFNFARRRVPQHGDDTSHIAESKDSRGTETVNETRCMDKAVKIA
ncbi:hypothetical protein BaRGS_00002303, partial [Batillaria attramentaria]